MVIPTLHDQSPWRHLAFGTATLLSAAAFGLAGATVASAQQPGSAGPPGHLRLAINDDEDTVKEDEDYRLEVVIQNAGPGTVNDATLEVNVAEEFDIDEISEVGDKTLIREDDDTLVWILGPLVPGQELQFSIHGEFEGVDKDDSNDTFESIVETFSPTAGNERDIEEVDVRNDT